MQRDLSYSEDLPELLESSDEDDATGTRSQHNVTINPELEVSDGCLETLPCQHNVKLNGTLSKSTKMDH